MKVEQTTLGKTGTLIFLVLISAFPPFSTDLYIPAMPQMVENLSTTEGMVNLTMSLYFIVYAVGLLIWGPLSENLGRKPILMMGLGIFIASSLLCAAAMNIELLIAFRLIQAFGGSAVTVIAISVVKDLFDGRQRERVMAIVMSLVMVGPMVAPVLGAFILQVSSWRTLFVVLAAAGAIAMGASLLFKESIEEKSDDSMLRSWGRLLVVLKNPNFSALLVIFSMMPMAILAFLVSAAYIYITGFGLSAQAFSFIFAFNALFATMGPILYIKLSQRISLQAIVSGCFALIMCCGLALYWFGDVSLWLFALTVALASLAVTLVEVPGMNLMLEQQERDTGSASALIQFFAMILGSVSMFLVSVDPANLIKSLGMIQFAVGLIGGGLWLLVRNRAFVKDKAPQLQQSI